MHSRKKSIGNIDLRTIKERTFEALNESPYLTPSKLCKKLRLDPRKHMGTLKTYRWEWKKSTDIGSPQKALVPHRRVFVWECVDRTLFCGFLGDFGWVEVANRNGMWVFRDVARGSVHWYKSGLVRLYLKGAVKLARAKELFCRAFRFLSDEDLLKFVDVPLREELRHWVFEVGAPMPRFDIRQFERSHGIRIFTDGSHPRAVEVEETTPFWLDRFENVTDKLGKEIDEHLSLLCNWQEESRTRIRQNCTFDPRPLYLGNSRWWDPVSCVRFVRISPGARVGQREG